MILRGGLTHSFTKTLVCRRTSAASTGAPPTVLPVGAKYSVASGFSLVLTENRNCIRRDAAFSRRGTPLNLTRGLLVNLHSPGEFPEGSRLFSLSVRVRQHSKQSVSKHLQIETPSSRFQTCKQRRFFCETNCSDSATLWSAQ